MCIYSLLPRRSVPQQPVFCSESVFGKRNNNYKNTSHVFSPSPLMSSSQFPALSQELGSRSSNSQTQLSIAVSHTGPQSSQVRDLMRLLPRMLSSEAWMPARSSGSPTLSASFLSRLRACLVTSCRLTSALTVAIASCLWACMLRRLASSDYQPPLAPKPMTPQPPNFRRPLGLCPRTPRPCPPFRCLSASLPDW